MVRRRIYTIADLDVNSSFIFAPDAFLALDYSGAPTLFQLEREIENNLHTNQDLKVGCPVCGNVDLFTREINTKGRRFRCGYCFYNSESEFETVKSQKDITLAKFGLLYECQICGEAIDSYNRGTVLRHIKKHQDENKVLESEGSAEGLISISEIKSLLRELKDNDYDWQDVVDWETDKPTPADNWDIEWEAEENIVYAVAVLQPENSKVSGVVHFADAGSGVAINYQIKGLTDGKHGFHIHEYGDLTDGCTSACAHFNPDNEVHGGLETPVRHFGDLGNIESQKSISAGEIYLPKAKLDSSKYGILGRMMIVHADPDDLGKGGDAESLKTGNAGKRLACGVIGLAEPPTHKQAESKMNLELGQQDPDDPNRMWGPDVISPIFPLKGYERPVEEVRADLKRNLVGHEIKMWHDSHDKGFSRDFGFSEPQPSGTWGKVTGVSDSNPNIPWVIGVWVTITQGGSPNHPKGSRVWFHVKDSHFPLSMSKGWYEGDYLKAEGIRECCECSTTEGLTTIQAGTFCYDCLPINLGAEEKVLCGNCNWSWNRSEGGDDLFICHKCGTDTQVSEAEVHLLPDAPIAGWYDRHDDSVNINLANKGIRNEALEDNYSGLFDTIAHEYGHQVTSHETRSPYHSEFAAFMVQTNGDFARSKLLAVIHPMCFHEIIMKLPPDSNGMISDETLDDFFSTLDFENNLDIIVQAKRFVTYPTIPEWHKDWLKHLISYVETGTSANVIFEAEEIVCPNCDWSWQRSEGGDDLFTCHKCGFDNETYHSEDDYDSTYGVKQAKIRRKLKNKIKKQAIMGTKAGQWSARKSQELKRQYEAACSKKGLKPYKGQKTKSQDNLSKWSKQGWKTASGKKSSVTGEPYFPAKAVTALKQKNLYAKAKRQKQAATKAGKQNARYSDDIRAVVKQYRAEDSECEVCRVPLSPEEKSLCNTCWESYEQSLKPQKEWWAESKRFSAPYQPNQTLLDYSPYEMATSSAITGDFFTDSLKYGFGPESKSSENVR